MRAVPRTVAVELVCLGGLFVRGDKLGRFVRKNPPAALVPDAGRKTEAAFSSCDILGVPL